MQNRTRKNNKYTKEFIDEVLSKYFKEGLSQYFLAKKYSISRKTISNWIIKSNKGVDPTIDTRKTNSGRKKESDIDYKEKYEILKKYQAFIKARREKK